MARFTARPYPRSAWRQFQEAIHHKVTHLPVVEDVQLALQRADDWMETYWVGNQYWLWLRGWCLAMVLFMAIIVWTSPPTAHDYHVTAPIEQTPVAMLPHVVVTDAPEVPQPYMPLVYQGHPHAELVQHTQPTGTLTSHQE